MRNLYGVHDLDYFICNYMQKKMNIKYNVYTKRLVIYSTVTMLCKILLFL